VSFTLSAFSDDLHSEFEGAAAIAADRGLDGLAVRNASGRNVVDLRESEVRRIARTAEDVGIVVTAVGSQIGRGFYLDDDEQQSKSQDDLARALEYAEILSAPLIRFFALWLPGQEALETWDQRPDFPLCLPALVDRITPLVAMAARAGRTLMVEVEGASYVGQVAEARQLMKAIDSPALGLCWDVCNGWWSGERPRDGWASAQGLNIVDVHTKDVPARSDDPSRPTFGRAVTGQGDVGLPWLLPELLRSGYEGTITAERVHHPLRPEEHPEVQQATLDDINGIVAITTGVRSRSAETTTSATATIKSHEES
jgi:sugar phosphate isomerase/epimerase